VYVFIFVCLCVTSMYVSYCRVGVINDRRYVIYLSKIYENCILYPVYCICIVFENDILYQYLKYNKPLFVYFLQRYNRKTPSRQTHSRRPRWDK